MPSPIRPGCRTSARVRLRVAAAVLLAAFAVAPSPALADKPPPPKAGTVPLELSQVAKANGPDLSIPDPDMKLAGKRVRFLANVADVGRTPAGEDFVVLRSGSSQIVLRLPGPLDDTAKLAGDKEWEVIARLDRPVTLGDGRAAIATPPDLLIKTPNLPSVVSDGDVVVRVAGRTSFIDPRIPDFESEEPTFRLTITKPGNSVGEYRTPGLRGLGNVTDENGRRFIDYRAINSAADGRQRAVRCQFRLDGGLLRNVAYGEVDLAPDGERTREKWIDFEDNQFTDKWSARQRAFPPNTYSDVCLEVVMAGFPVGEANVVRFFLWGDAAMPIPLYVYADGEETLDVRGRPERAVRLKLGLDVREAARAIEVPEVWRHHAEQASEVWFAGETTYWIAADAPHVVLRYRGPLGGPGAPEATVDRIR